jgi:hypothetical protein
MKNGASYLIAFVLLAGIIFLMPNGIEPRIQRITGFTLSMLIAAGVYIAFRVDMALGALILYVCLKSVLMAYYDPHFYYMLFALIVFLVWAVKAENINKEILYDLLIAVACLNLIWQVLQIFNIHIVIKSHYQIPGLMSNINETSALYAITAPAFFRKKRYWLLPVIVAGLILSGSFQGVVAFAIVSVLWAFYKLPLKKSMTALVISIVSISCFVIFIKPFSYKNYESSRIYVWEQSLKVASVKPVFGWGFNQYRVVIPLITSWKYLNPTDQKKIYSVIKDKKAFEQAVQRVENKDSDFFPGNKQQGELFMQAHNEYVEWLFVGGFVGLLLALAFLGRLLWEAFKQYDSIPFYGLLSASIVCLFGFSWHLMPLALITVLYIALIEREAWKKKNKAIEEGENTDGYCSGSYNQSGV